MQDLSFSLSLPRWTTVVPRWMLFSFSCFDVVNRWKLILLSLALNQSYSIDVNLNRLLSESLSMNPIRAVKSSSNFCQVNQ
jgi:hypothetical protein